MPRRFRFRLRTMLIATAFVAMFFGLAPWVYNWYVWRPVEQELAEWLATAEFPNGEPLGYDYVLRSAREARGYSAVFPPKPSYPLYQISNHPLEIGEIDNTEQDDNTTERVYFIYPTSKWVATKQEALDGWRERYLEQHGWRWPL